MRKLTLLLIVLFTLVVKSTVFAKETVKIHLGAPKFQPYSYTDPKTGRCIGIAISRLKQILQPYNLDVIASCAPPARLYRSIFNGTVDISVNVKSTDALQESVSFNTIPFDNLTLNFYTNVIEKDSNKKVATIKGYDYGGFRQHLIDQGYELLDVPNLEDAVRIFANKRTKYLISYGGPVTHYFESETSNKGSLKPANIDTELLLSIPTYIAISKASQHHDLLVDIFKELDSKSEIPYIERD